MALRGDTSNLLLSDIFQTLSQNGQHGMLMLRREGLQVRILFTERGVTPFDAKVYHAARLARLLVAGGLITQDQADACLAEVDEAGPDPFSAIPFLCLLEEKGFLELDRGAKVLQIEVREELFEAFNLPRMEFEFDDGDVANEGIPPQCFFRTEEVIFEAARRLDECALIQNTLGDSADSEFFISCNDAPIDPRVEALLDGSHTIQDVAERLLMPRFEVSRIVARLMDANLLRPAGADELVQAARLLDPTRDKSRIVRILQRARMHLAGEDPRLDDVSELLMRAGATSPAIAVMLTRARALLEDGNQETAYTLVRRARDLDPHNVGVLTTLADLHHERGEIEGELQALTSLAEHHAADKAFEDAFECAVRVAAIYPDSPLLERSFAIYAQQADEVKRGADVLMAAASLCSTAERATALYRAVLQLDPDRGEARRALTRLRKKRTRRRLVIIGLVAIVLPGLGLIGYRAFDNFDQQRSRGRLESARTLIEKGEASLAVAELQSVLAEAGDRPVGEEANVLLVRAKAMVAEKDAAAAEERVRQNRSAIAALVGAIEAHDYAASIERAGQIAAANPGDAEVRANLATKVKILFRALEEEHANLVRLAGKFEEPTDDAELLAVHERYRDPFSPARKLELTALAHLLLAPPAGVDLAAHAEPAKKLVREALQCIEQVESGLASISARLQRNEALDVLSKDFEEIQDAERAGEFAEAARGYDRLLRAYGTGPLTDYFTRRRNAALAVHDAVERAKRLTLAGDAAEAQRTIHAADAAIAEFEIVQVIGIPIWVETIPIGVRLVQDGRAIGTAPTCVWVRFGLESRIESTSPGFQPKQVLLSTASEARQVVQLQREGRFETAIGAPISVTPLVDGSRLFVGARNGRLYEIDLTDGRKRVEQPTGSLAGIAAPPVAVAGNVVLSLGEGELRAYAMNGLNERWRCPVGQALVGPPVVDGGDIFVATSGGDVVRVNASSGTKSNVARVSTSVRSGPIVWNDLVAVGKSDGSVVAIDRASGAVRFQTKARAQPVIGMAASRLGVLFADDGGSLVALDTAGEERWWFAAGEPAAAPPIAFDGLVVFAAGKTAYVIDERDGTVRMRAEVDSWIGAAPALAGGRLYIGDRQGRLTVFDVTTGDLLFQHVLGGELRASPIILPEGVLIVSDDGIVAMIGA